MKQLAFDEEVRYIIAATFILDLYTDDLITSTNTYEDVHTVRHELKQLANESFGPRLWSFKQKDSGLDPVSTEDTSDLIIEI